MTRASCFRDSGSRAGPAGHRPDRALQCGADARESGPASDQVLAVAVLSELMRIDEEALGSGRRLPAILVALEPARRLAAQRGQSSHLRVPGWRARGRGHRALSQESVCCWILPGRTLLARAERAADGGLVADLGGERVHATVVRSGRELTVFTGGLSHRWN